jgi:hypothetical protein
VIQVVSTFTSRPLAATLRPLLVGAGVADSLEFVEYAQVSEYMLGPASDAEQVIGTVVLVRVEDWLRSGLISGTPDNGSAAPQDVSQALSTQLDDFLKQIAALARRGKPVWLLACPSNGWISQSYKLAPLCRTYTNLLLARTRSTPNVSILDWPNSLSGVEVDDRNADRLGQIPFTPAAFEQLGQWLGPEIEVGLATKTVSASCSSGQADLAKFLEGLELQVCLVAPEFNDHGHVDKILRTAAAFSLTGEKPDLSPIELQDVLASGECVLIRVSDRLANYGPAGILVFSVAGDTLVVKAFALICPVLGKQVEYAVISGLARIAAARNCQSMLFRYRPSGRNQMMLNFLRSLAHAGSTTPLMTLAAIEVEERIRKTAVAPGAWTLDIISESCGTQRRAFE